MQMQTGRVVAGCGLWLVSDDCDRDVLGNIEFKWSLVGPKGFEL